MFTNYIIIHYEVGLDLHIFIEIYNWDGIESKDIELRHFAFFYKAPTTTKKCITLYCGHVGIHTFRLQTTSLRPNCVNKWVTW